MATIPKLRVSQPDNLPVPAPPVLRAVAELEPERGYLSREMAELAVVNELSGEEDVLVQQNGKARKTPLRYIVALAKEVNTPPNANGRIGGGGGRHTYERSVMRSPLETPTATDYMLAVRDGVAIKVTLESIGTFAGDMLKAVYDIDDDAAVDNSERLGGELPSYYLAAGSYTAADILTKLLTVDGAGSGLDADLLDAHSSAYYLDRTNHTGTQLASTVSDFSEAVDDRVAVLIVNGTGISWAYNDGAGTLTPTISLSPFSTSDLAEGSRLYYTDERVDDRVAALLQNGTGISWSYNDGSNTLTPTVSLAAFSTSNLSEGSNLYYTDERVDDRVAVLIQNGTGISWSYNDASGTLTPTISLASFSTTNLSEGSNLYFTDERAQDAVGTILTDSATIDFTYNDGANTITAIVIDDSVSNAKLANMATQTFKGRTTAGTGDPEDLTVAQAKTLLSLAGTNSGDQTITLTGDVTGSGTGSFAATIANDAVTYAKMQNVSATSRFIGRKTAGAGDPEELTASDAKTILALVKGDVGLGNVDNTADVSKSVASAAALTTARNIDGQSFDGSANITVIAPGTHAATSKATPVDADELPLVDSAASNVLKKLTWANLKATLKTYFDTLYVTIGAALGNASATTLSLTGASTSNAINASGLTPISVANGASEAISNIIGGLILVHDTSTNAEGIYFGDYGNELKLLSAAGTVTVFVAPTTTPSAGQASIQFDGSVGLRIYNNRGATSAFRICAVKMR